MGWILIAAIWAIYGVGAVLTAIMSYHAWPRPRLVPKSEWELPKKVNEEDWGGKILFASLCWPIGVWVALVVLIFNRFEARPHVETLEHSIKEIEAQTKRLRGEDAK